MKNELPASGRLLIGDLILDTGKRQVRRGRTVLELPRLSYQLVLALAETAPNLVTHEELVRRVWPGKIVSPETVTQRIKLVRQVLGDDAHLPRYIGLVRGEGYRMLADVTPVPSNEPQQVESISDAAALATAENPTESITRRTMRKLSFTIVTSIGTGVGLLRVRHFPIAA